LRIAEGIMKSDDPDLPKVLFLASGFEEKAFEPVVLSGYADSALAKIYDALFRISFFFPEHPRSADLQAKILEEKLRRGQKSDSDIERLHRAYVGARRFPEAEALGGRFPGLKYQYLPKISGSPAGGPFWLAYSISPSAEEASLGVLPLARGAKVVMGMFPGCGASEKAMEDILADPEMGAVFKAQGSLLTLRFDPRSMALWRDHFKFPQVHIAYKPSAFPGFDFDSSPNFYFLSDGKIAYAFTGWSNRKNPDFGRTEFFKGLSAISVSTAAAASK